MGQTDRQTDRQTDKQTDKTRHRVALQLKIKKIKKRFLKKCRHCNFKKRSCILNPSSCEALNRNCFQCSKRGHFPKSMNCKSKTKYKKKQRIECKESTNSVKISKSVLHLIRERTKELKQKLELEQKLEEIQRVKQICLSKSFQTEIIPTETIPFFVMFILLNYDFMMNQQLETWQKMNRKIAIKSKTCILKTAKYCARKFTKNQQEDKKDYFLRYCLKKASTIIQDQPLPDIDEKASMQRTLNVYDQMFYNSGKQDGSNDSDDPPNQDYAIPQFDGGNDSESSIDEGKIEKNVFAINCEIDEITHLVNFFRGCNFLWESLMSHCICNNDQKQTENNCFFCHMRSTCIRLNTKRTKGPRSLKLFEFSSQLLQYKINGWSWRENRADIVSFVGNTIKLLRRSENSISSSLGFPEGRCKQCQIDVKLKRKYIYEIETGDALSEPKEIMINDIFCSLVLTNGNQECCLEGIELEKHSNKYVIFQFSNPTEIKLSLSEKVWGRKFKYMSHVEECDKEDKKSVQTFFRLGDKMLYQDQRGDIKQSTFNTHKNVKLLAIMFTEDINEMRSEALDTCVYGSQTQKYLRKHYLSVISPDKYHEKQLIQRENDRERDQTEERKKSIKNWTKKEIKIQSGKRCIKNWTKKEIKIQSGNRCIKN